MNNAKQTLVAFELDDQCYGLHLAQVLRVERAALPTPLPGSPAIVMGVLDVRGDLAPVINVRRRFGRPEREVTPEDQFIIARTAARAVVLPADRVRGVVACAATAAAGERVTHTPLVEGVVQLADGLMLIHDLEKFLTAAEESQLDTAITAAGGEGGPRG